MAGYVHILAKGKGFALRSSDDPIYEGSIISYKCESLEEARMFTNYLVTQRWSAEAFGILWTPPTQEYAIELLKKVYIWKKNITRQYESGVRKRRNS